MGEEEPEEKRERGIYGYSVLIVRREGERKFYLSFFLFILFIFCAGTRLAFTVGWPFSNRVLHFSANYDCGLLL